MSRSKCVDMSNPNGRVMDVTLSTLLRFSGIYGHF